MPGYTNTLQTSMIESQVGAGPAKVRPRFIYNSQWSIYTNCKMYLTAAQRASFLNFWQNTLQNGFLSFDVADPDTGNNVTARMRAMPQLSPVSTTYWLLTYTLEILP